jgi:hypothetical protein
MSVTDGVTKTGLWSISTLSDVGWEYSLDEGSSWIIGIGDSFEILQDGEHTIWVRSRDNFGNVSEVVVAKCLFDTQAPTAVSGVLVEQTGVTRFDLAGFESNAGWEVSFNQGQSWSSGNSASVSFIGNAFPKVLLRQVDLAGNRSEPTELLLEGIGPGWREISTDPLKPDFVGALDHTLLVHGDIARNDADYFRLDIPPSATLRSAMFSFYQSADPIAFYAIQQNSVFDAGTDTSKMLAFGHFGPQDVGRNLLPSGANPSALTGSITTWVNQTGSLSTRYALQMDMVKGGDSGDTSVLSPRTLSIKGFHTNSMSSEIVTGLGDRDTFVYQASSALYSLQVTNSGLTISSRAGSEVDRLTGVERIKFLDKSFAFDIDGNAGQAYRIYKAAFNRDPMAGDTKGLGFWISQIDDGMDLLEVSARFVDSNEFKTLYGNNPSNEQFLTTLYQNVLGRQPDASGFNWWLNQLNTEEKTKAKVLADFAEIDENQAGVIGLIGNGITYEPWLG